MWKLSQYIGADIIARFRVRQLRVAVPVIDKETDDTE